MVYIRAYITAVCDSTFCIMTYISHACILQLVVRHSLECTFKCSLHDLGGIIKIWHMAVMSFYVLINFTVCLLLCTFVRFS